MSIWLLLLMVFIAGAVGGGVSSIINGKQQPILPGSKSGGDGVCLFLPGYVGNIISGAVAAIVSWALYGPLSQAQIGAVSGTVTMTVATLGGAVLVGMAGSAWLAKATGQKLFQAAAFNAAAAPATTDEAAKKMLTSSPMDALEIAKSMKLGGAPAQPTSTQPVRSQNGLPSEPVVS